jgi:hypothetical protein
VATAKQSPLTANQIHRRPPTDPLTRSFENSPYVDSPYPNFPYLGSRRGSTAIKLLTDSIMILIYLKETKVIARVSGKDKVFRSARKIAARENARSLGQYWDYHLII